MYKEVVPYSLALKTLVASPATARARHWSYVIVSTQPLTGKMDTLRHKTEKNHLIRHIVSRQALAVFDAAASDGLTDAANIFLVLGRVQQQLSAFTLFISVNLGPNSKTRCQHI